MRIRRPLYLASYSTMVLRSVNINITIITTKTFLPTFSTKLFPTICPPFFQCSSPMILRNSNIKSQTPGILSSHSRSTGWSMSVPKDSKSSWITPPFKDMFTSHVVSIDYVIICQMYMWHIWRWTVLTRGGRAGLPFTAQHTGLNNMISISIIVIIIIIITQHTGIFFGIILLYHLLRDGFNGKTS